MGDELDPYGLLEQAYNETVGENIEDISPANSPSSDEHVNDGSTVPFPQRSFIAHKEIKNIDLGSTEDHADDDEEQEKLQFDFDVPSPAFEAISDEEDPGESRTTGENSPSTELGNKYETPLNRANTPVESTNTVEAQNLTSYTEARREQDDHNLKHSESSNDIANPLNDDVMHHNPDVMSQWHPLHESKGNEDSVDSRATNDSTDNASKPVSISPVSEDSYDDGMNTNRLSQAPNNEVVFNAEDFMFKETTETQHDIGEEGGTHDAEAPVPSPFSDIDDISEPENAIISDILKDTEGGIPVLTEEDIRRTGEASVDVKDQEETPSLPILNQSRGESQIAVETDSTPPQKLQEAEEETKEKEGDEADENVQDVGGLIADIFGESDDEEEEFEGFAEDELYPEKAKVSEKPKSKSIISDDEDDEEDEPLATGREVPESLVPEESSDEELDDLKAQKQEMVSDFDLMMQRKKEMNKSKRRGRRDFDIINDNDDIIAAMIKQMKDAAEALKSRVNSIFLGFALAGIAFAMFAYSLEGRQIIEPSGASGYKEIKDAAECYCASSKPKAEMIVEEWICTMRDKEKADLQHTFIDCGILPVMKEWLQPLPDNSLPHIQIRSSLLRALLEFPPLDKGALKLSGVGRSVMLLFKHPKECRPNRKMAGKIIAEWARPIFGVTTKFTEMSREDREERDKMNVPAAKKRRLSSVEGESGTSRPIDQALNEDKKARRPGDRGFIGRARVPMPSNRDYVVRPKSNVEVYDTGRNQKKAVTRYDQQYRKYKDRVGALGQKGDRAVGISLNGSKMSL